MTKRTAILWTLAGAALVGALAWAFAPRPVEVETARVTQGHFEATIDEDGKTRLRDRYVVSAPLAGVLTRITLREGDAVDADTVLAHLTPVPAPLLDARTLREQEARLETTRAQVMRASARAEGAKVALLQARNQQQRSEQLANQGFVSLNKLESDRLEVQAAQKELDAAIEERHVAEHEVEQARAVLTAVRGTDPSKGRDFALRAPTAGRVLRVAQTSEGAVATGTPLMEIGDTRGLEVVAELLTTDALRAPAGSRVIIERWGGPGNLEGCVRLVEPSAFTKVSALGVEEQRVKVVIDITSPAQAWSPLGDGYRVGVRIVTLSVDDAVQVPVSAVFPLPDAPGSERGRMALFVLDGGRARLTAVNLGARNAGQAWIKAGVAAGAEVIVYPQATIKDGARVKVRHV